MTRSAGAGTRGTPGGGSDSAERTEAVGDGTRDPVETVRRKLDEAGGDLRRRGLAVPEVRGKLLRPRFAHLVVPARWRSELDGRFWSGALAVQMVHEASLVHDDILEGARERRNRPTLLARAGLQAALVQGDRYLTSSYRAAAAVGSPSYLRTFVEAVDRTVQGEAEQGASRGQVLELSAYRTMIEAKSGALFGAALSLGPSLLDHGDPEAFRRLGLRVGGLYQMVDDLLDYCPVLDRGKPALQDFGQEKWTHVLEGVPDPFDAAPDRIVARLVADGSGDASPLRRALDRIETEIGALQREIEELAPGATAFAATLEGWCERARAGVRAQERAVAGLPDPRERPSPVRPSRLPVAGSGTRGPANPEAKAGRRVAEMARSMGGPDSWPRLFARHSRSFRFASLLFPGEARRRITGIYVYCRFTDDLVDRARGVPPARLRRRMEAWRALSRRAYDRADTGVPLLDRVLGDAARRGVSFRHVSDLLDGVAMDVEPESYRDLAHLRTYTYGVAGTVGGWVAETFGARSAGALARAHALGRGMQLTNIVRDVGEDLRTGRLYLPLDRMAAHGVERRSLERAAAGDARAPAGLSDLLEELMAEAEAEYDRGLGGLSHLPVAARIPVAVAARVYRGIHREIRNNAYDVLDRRAYTSGPRKALLAAGALAGLLVRPLRGATPPLLASPGEAFTHTDEAREIR